MDHALVQCSEECSDLLPIRDGSNSSTTSLFPEKPFHLRAQERCKTVIKWVVAACSLILNIVLIAVLLHIWGNYNLEQCQTPQLLFSPAQEAVNYKVQKFHTGFGNQVSIYQQPPSAEVDRAWTQLYDDFGIIRIPKEKALQLPNTTYPYVNDPGYYIGELSVFHQLHCLNRLRQSLHPNYYRQIYPDAEFGEEGTLGIQHLSHCVEAIRESLMCASDVSVIVWQWNNISHKAQAHAGIVHSCTDFDAIRTWAIENQAKVEFIDNVFVQDEVTNPN